MIIELIGGPNDGQVMSIPSEFDVILEPTAKAEWFAVYGLRPARPLPEHPIAFDFESYATAGGVIDGG